MFSDKTKQYFLATSKKAFLESFSEANEKSKKFSFGEVLFVKNGVDVYAIKNKCPHQGSKMEGCEIEEGKVICPRHRYRFNLETGRGHSLYLPIYELKEKEDGFYLLHTYFSWFGE